MTELDDGADGVCDAHCSLREAIDAVNASGKPEVIQLGRGIYSLTLPARTKEETDTVEEDDNALGDLDIAGHLVLAGAGADRTFIAGLALRDRVLEVLPGAVVTLRDLSITGGDVSSRGGGIANAGTLLLERVSVIGNAAFGWASGSGGGIFNEGELRVHASTISDNRVSAGESQLGEGGGILNWGWMLIEDSSLSSNVAHNDDDASTGGGLSNWGWALIRRSLFDNNSALRGGAVANLGGGELTLVETTVTGSYQSVWNGGPPRLPGKIELHHVTIAGNSGGLRNWGEVVSRNTIIAGNSAFDDFSYENMPNCDNRDNRGVFVSLGGTLLGDDDGNCDSQGPGDLLVDEADVFVSLLGPLAQQGGPTETHAPLPNSLALGAGHAEWCDTAQAPLSERVGTGAGSTACDIGAHQGVADLLRVTRLEDGFDGVCDADCSLRDAVAEANRRAVPSVVLLGAGAYRLTLPPLDEASEAVTGDAGQSHGDLDITGTLTLLGSKGTSISAEHDDRLLDVMPGARVVLRSLDLFRAQGRGGGHTIRNRGQLDLRACTLSGDAASSAGGGIFNEDSLTLHTSQIRDHDAVTPGGGIFNTARGSLLVSRSEVVRNRATGVGGGVANKGISVLLSSDLRENLSVEGGGGLANLAGGQALIVGSVEANTSEGPGGGILNGGRLVGSWCGMHRNGAASQGGGLYAASADSSFGNCSFSANEALEGGGIYSGEKTSLRGAFIADNRAERGAGLYNAGGALSLEQTRFLRNRATLEGGALHDRGGPTTITGGDFTDNAAEFVAGAIVHNSSEPMRLHSVFITGNSAAIGGAIFNNLVGEQQALEVENSTIYANRATIGAAFAIDGGPVLIVNSTIAENEATERGGGFGYGDGARVVNTIFAGNRAPAGPDCERLASLGNNIFGDPSGCDIELLPSDAIGDPLLSELRSSDAFTPLTWFLEPLPRSPAIDTANPDWCPSHDQQGTPRPQGVSCDIGAVEVVVGTPATVR